MGMDLEYEVDDIDFEGVDLEELDEVELQEYLDFLGD